MVKEVKDVNGKVVATLLTEEDVDYTLGKKVLAVIGYGIQGRAQALCQRDFGHHVIVGLRKGKSWDQALKDGFVENDSLFTVAEACKKADVIQILLPDPVHGKVYKESIEPGLEPGKTLAFSHGYSITYRHIVPPRTVDVVLLAPKGPGSIVRETFSQGFGVPALYAIEQDATGEAEKTVLALARGIGATRPGVMKTTFKDETETDLFGEQVDLVGGIIELVKRAYETLLEDGRNPVLAYWEIHHELFGLIAPLSYKRGNAGMMRAVSDTAKYGAIVSGPRVIDESIKENMRDVLEDIKNGNFARQWDKAWAAKGPKSFTEDIKKLDNHPLEFIGKQVRKIMWPNEQVE
ncbi:MAG: ketol-acid reductoisomerase [Candidatus Ranarchaeia archaeon]